MRMLRSALVVCVAFACIAFVANASPITGVTNISGSVNVGNTGAFLYVDFFSTPLACATPSLGVAGCAAVNAASTGDFPAPGPAEATIKDLQAPPLPVSGAVNLPAWIVFTGGSNVTFDLTTLVPGAGPDCATLTLAQLQAPNQSCTAYFGGVASPFTLTNDNLASNVAVRFTAEVNAWKVSAATGVTPMEGQFTSQVPGNLASVLVNANTPAGFAPGGVSYSANFTPTAVPEPSALMLVGCALIACGCIRKRKVTHQ